MNQNMKELGNIRLTCFVQLYFKLSNCFSVCLYKTILYFYILSTLALYIFSNILFKSNNKCHGSFNLTSDLNF